MDECLKYLRDFRSGKESGLRYFMSKFGSSLRFFAFSIVQDKEVAEEIVSDSFFKLWQGRDRIQTADSIKAFLYISTRNTCYDYVKSPKNKMSFSDEKLEKLVLPDPDILSKIIYLEWVEQITEAVNKLPKQQAQVFQMAYLEGLNTQEICDKLGITANSVYFARSKALSSIKKAFRETQLE